MDVDTGNRGPVTVTCPRCHRPLGALEWDGDHATFVADVVEPENGDPSGTLRTVGNRSAVTARVTSADSAVPAGAASALGRKTIRCESRRHRTPVARTFTPQAITDTYRRVVEAGHVGVSLDAIRANTVQH